MTDLIQRCTYGVSLIKGRSIQKSSIDVINFFIHFISLALQEQRGYSFVDPADKVEYW